MVSFPPDLRRLFRDDLGVRVRGLLAPFPTTETERGRSPRRPAASDATLSSLAQPNDANRQITTADLQELQR